MELLVAVPVGAIVSAAALLVIVGAVGVAFAAADVLLTHPTIDRFTRWVTGEGDVDHIDDQVAVRQGADQ